MKLIKLHDLPGVILEWRKLDNSVSKKICPLLNAYEHHPGLSMARIYSVCKTFNVNGRVYLNDPNIQNVPNDFEVVATPQLIRKALGQNESMNNKSGLLLSYASLLVDLPQDEEESYKVSLRKAFVASESCLIIAADYSQLELRILAHMSQDSKLLQILGRFQIRGASILQKLSYQKVELMGVEVCSEHQKFVFISYLIQLKNLGDVTYCKFY